MLLTLIIPVFNSEKTLLKCLNSLPNTDDVEIILVDDGSVDNSKQIAQEYAKINSSVIILSQENSGPQKAINFGLKFSKGKYISFVDSDDTLSEDYFDVLENFLRTEEADIICFSYNRVNKNSIEKVMIEAKDWYSGEELKKFKLNYLVEGKMRFSHLTDPARWNKIFKAEIILSNLNYFSESFKLGEDILMTTLCVLSANKILCLNNSFLYNYYITDNSLSKSNELLGYWNKYCNLALLIYNAYLDKNFKDFECKKVKGILLYFSKSILKMASKNYSYKQFKRSAKLILEHSIFIESLDYVEKKKLDLSNRLLFSFFKSKNYLMIFILFRLKR